MARTGSKGFSLLEIIVVVALIGIMSAIAVKPIRGLIQRIRIQNAAEGIKHYVKTARSRAISNAMLHCGVQFINAAGTTPDTVFAFLDNKNPSAYAYTAGQDSLYLKPYVLLNGIQLSIASGTSPIVFRADGSANTSIKVVFTLGTMVDTLDVLASTGRVMVKQ